MILKNNHSEMDFPLITVVTVSYNAASTIEGTILSVINQTYSNIEYIIIDGGSTDGTVDIIKKYSDKISYWVSEPDKGIYDAMNKGIAKATGKWINFMNAGDTFYDEKVIDILFKNYKNKDKYVAVYGNTEYVYSRRRIMIKQLSDRQHRIMPSCHQSIFCLTGKMKEHGFNTKYRFAADFDFFYWLYQKGLLYKYIDTPVAVYDATSGLSSLNALACFKEIQKIAYVDRLTYMVNLTLFKIKHTIKKILKYNV